MNELDTKELVDVRPHWTNGNVYTFKKMEDFMDAGSKSYNTSEISKKMESRRKFIELVKYPEFWAMDLSERALALDVTPATVQKWLIQVPDEYLVEALKVQRERSVRRSLEVDSYLMGECKKGNVKAMELYYRRIERWVPAQGMELSRGKDKEVRDVSTVELVKGLLGTLTPEQKAEIMRDGGGNDSGADTAGTDTASS